MHDVMTDVWHPVLINSDQPTARRAYRPPHNCMAVGGQLNYQLKPYMSQAAMDSQACAHAKQAFEHF